MRCGLVQAYYAAFHKNWQACCHDGSMRVLALPKNRDEIAYSSGRFSAAFMARIGYCRTSTLEQDTERQRTALLEAGCSRIYEEQASGKTMDRPVLQECLSYLRAGDTLVVHELDRLGRTMSGMLVCVEQLLERGIHLRTLDGRLNTEGMDESLVKLLVGVLGYAAETERKMLLKRTAEGRQIAKNNGVKLGRKRGYSEGAANHVRELREQGHGYGTIASKTGLSIGTVRRIVGVQ